MITVRAHNKKTGEITVMRVQRERRCARSWRRISSNKGVKAERLSWKRRSSAAFHDNADVARRVGGGGRKTLGRGRGEIRPAGVRLHGLLQESTGSSLSGVMCDNDKITPQNLQTRRFHTSAGADDVASATR